NSIDSVFRDAKTGEQVRVNASNIDQARYEHTNCETFGYQSSDKKCDKYLVLGNKKLFLGRASVLATGDTDPIAQYNARKSAINSRYLTEKNKLLSESMYEFFQPSGYIGNAEAEGTESVQNVIRALSIGDKETSDIQMTNIITDGVGTA